jgi:peptidoglycan/xylan/chitin deacetylase (PgdA/CDA1 family)
MNTMRRKSRAIGVVIVSTLATGTAIGMVIVNRPSSEPAESRSLSALTQTEMPRVVIARQPAKTVTDTSAVFTALSDIGEVGNSTEARQGEGSVSIVTARTGEATVARRELPAELDLSGSTIKLWVTSNDWAAVAQAQIRLYSSDDTETFLFASIKDHLAATALPDDEWVEVNLPRSAFEKQGAGSDFAHIEGVSFAAWTSNGTTPKVLFNHVTSHPDGDEGAISLTFDDGRASQMSGAAILDEFGYPATAYVIDPLIGTPGYLTESEVQDLYNRGWDIGGHANAPLTTLTDAAIEANVSASANWLRLRGYLGDADYAYPNGAVDERVAALVGQYFSTARTINPSGQPWGYVNVSRISSVSVYATMPDSEVFTLVDAAVANCEWLVITFHGIGEGSDELSWDPDRLRALLQHIKDSGAPVRTVSAEVAALRDAQGHQTS